jgi:hypothetical protein
VLSLVFVAPLLLLLSAADALKLRVLLERARLTAVAEAAAARSASNSLNKQVHVAFEAWAGLAVCDCLCHASCAT